MPAKSAEPLVRLCVRIREADDNILEEMCALQKVGKNRLIREMIRSYVAQSSALVRRNIDRIEPMKQEDPDTTQVRETENV
jgi:hypothetical protein